MNGVEKRCPKKQVGGKSRELLPSVFLTSQKKNTGGRRLRATKSGASRSRPYKKPEKKESQTEKERRFKQTHEPGRKGEKEIGTRVVTMRRGYNRELISVLGSTEVTSGIEWASSECRAGIVLGRRTFGYGKML